MQGLNFTLLLAVEAVVALIDCSGRLSGDGVTTEKDKAGGLINQLPIGIFGSGAAELLTKS